MKIIRNKLNTVIITIVVLTVISTLYTSCSLQKRVHNKGFHIEKIFTSNDNSSKEQSKSRRTSNPITLRPFSQNKTSVWGEYSNKQDFEFAPTYSTIVMTKSVAAHATTASNGDSCDVIVFKNGEQINAIVLEISDNEVKFRECDKPNGPVFVKQRSSIVRINYPNGTSTVISSDRYVSFGQSNHNGEKDPNDRSLLVTVLLWAFVGTLGIHRMYLGHYGIGILYLLTGGLCGIGWLIDGIMLITGELKPKNGKYVN